MGDVLTGWVKSLSGAVIPGIVWIAEKTLLRSAIRMYVLILHGPLPSLHLAEQLLLLRDKNTQSTNTSFHFARTSVCLIAI